MKTLFVALTLMAFTGVGLRAEDTGIRKSVEDYRGWSTDSLVNVAREDVNRMAYDDALLKFTVAASRDDKNMSEAESRIVMDAYVGKWYVYFFNYFDHVNAYKALARAEEIAESIGYDAPRIPLDFGCMYQALGEQSSDTTLIEKAYGYYKKSFDNSAREKDVSGLNMSFGNLVQVGHMLGRFKEVKPYWHRYRKEQESRNTPAFHWDSLFYRMFEKIDAGDHDGAITDIDVMLNEASDYVMIRYKYVAYTYKADLLTARGDYAGAERQLQLAKEMTDLYGMKDGKVEIYRKMMELCDASGDKAGALEWQRRYLSVKDSVLNYRQGAAIGELTFLKKMAGVEEELAGMKERRARQNTVTLIVIILAAATTVFLVVLRRRNRKLHLLNETLYQKTVDLIRTEQETRALLDKEKAAPAKAAPAKTEPEAETEQEAPSQKYQNSDLNDEEKVSIMKDVRAVMLTSPEVYSPDFSAARLSELTGYTYRHISQAINETTGNNFSNFVNEYRIKEACRRIQSGGVYDTITMEGMANEVGFRAKSSFFTAFKKFTGMTPANYQKMARDGRSEGSKS